MDRVYFFNYIKNNFDFSALTKLNQAFVDTIRNSGGYNIERLLIIAGANDELIMTCSSDYKMPIDQSNKLAVSIHYYEPFDFVLEKYYESFNWIDDKGYIYWFGPTLKWGSFSEYNKIFDDFKLIKSTFVDKGIPVIINEIGILTEEKKEIESIREYLYILFSISSDYDGIMCCLWDTSNKIFGDMNFYDRTNDIWYDEKIKNNFLQISRNEYIKSIDYIINTNFESVDTHFILGELIINFENKKVK